MPYRVSKNHRCGAVFAGDEPRPRQLHRHRAPPLRVSRQERELVVPRVLEPVHGLLQVARGLQGGFLAVAALLQLHRRQLLAHQNPEMPVGFQHLGMRTI